MPVESLVSSGGLLSVTYGEKSAGMEAARLTKNILDGKLPENMVQPSQLDITISLKVAKKIGVEIPEPIVRAAQQIP